MGPRSANVPLRVRAVSATLTAPAAPRGALDWPERERRRQAVGAAAGGEQADLAEARDVHQRRVAAPGGAGGEPLGRAPERDDRLDAGAEPARVGERAERRARQHQRGVGERLALRGEHVRIAAVMQRQRAAGEQPGQHGQGNAGKGGGRDRRQDIGLLGEAGFQKNAKPAGHELQMAARNRHDAGGGDVESDERDMGGGRARPRARPCTLSGASSANRSSSGTTPSGKSRPKAQTWRMGNSSAAAKRRRCARARRRAVTIALAPMPRSAATISCCRHSSGSGAAIMPARSTPSSAITLSTVLGSCRATTASARRPSPRRRAAMAEIGRSASA